MPLFLSVMLSLGSVIVTLIRTPLLKLPTTEKLPSCMSCARMYVHLPAIVRWRPSNVKKWPPSVTTPDFLNGGRMLLGSRVGLHRKPSINDDSARFRSISNREEGEALGL